MEGRTGGGGQHRVRIPAHGAGPGKAVAPEKQLNRFVRLVALIERVGNALGTLAFTWATVVLLGGYPTALRPDDDFWFTTTIVFLEAARMFSRNNRLDYQLLFNTRGAFKPLASNGLIVIGCFSGFFMIVWKKFPMINGVVLFFMAILLAIGRFMSEFSPRKLLICNPLRRVISLCSPLIAILLLAPSIPPSKPSSSDIDYEEEVYDDYDTDPFSSKSITAEWTVFLVLLVAMFVVAISRLRFTRIMKLVDCALGSKQEFWRQVILNSCMVAVLVMLVFIPNPNERYVMIIIEVCALVIVSFGNLQTPAAVLRVMLSLLRLIPRNYYDDDDDKNNPGDQTNLVASLDIFYGMVLGQGMLYGVACVLEFFSFIPRRSLIRCGGFSGQWGVESVNLYYAYAFERCMQGGVLAPKKISLITFAMDFLNSDSSNNQLYGIRMMNSFLQKEATKAQLLSTLTTSTKTMARIIRMLDWTSPKDTAIRIYAAKVNIELAKNLRLVTFPGTVQLVSALLDADRRLKRGNPLLDTDDEQEERQDPFLNTEASQEEDNDVVRDVADNQGQRGDQLRDTTNLLETQISSTQQVGIDEQNSCMLRCYQRISEFWSIPKEQLLTDHDLLPALAMSIIDSLAGCDQDNCVEISKAAGLIPKIIGFTSYRSDMSITEAQQKVLLKSSLKVLQRLTSIGGEIGITLRYEISKHPFLLRNLMWIMGDRMSDQEFRKLVAGILRNLAVDGKTRQEIGCVQLIITMLMQEFLNVEGTMSTNVDRLLRKVAGQALAMLTTENVHNCLVMLKEPELIKRLKPVILIHDDKYIYVAASLLRNLCLHARPELRESDLKELSHTLREVLEKIMYTEGAELEILIGLSSQICKIIPEDFAREVYDGQIERRFAKRLVDTLNANTEPSAKCPGIRRVVLEQVIYMMEYNSRYADCFNKCRMTEALSMVEQTLSKADNYKLFLGDTGFMEYSTPLSALVARAKELMGCD